PSGQIRVGEVRPEVSILLAPAVPTLDTQVQRLEVRVIRHAAHGSRVRACEVQSWVFATINRHKSPRADRSIRPGGAGSSGVGLDSQSVVHGNPEFLLASEVALRCLD